MKSSEVKREARKQAYRDLIDAIPCWPLEYDSFLDIIKRLENGKLH
jgi:hypothetical protein